MSSSPSALPQRWQLNFAAIWIGQQASLIGSAVAQFALVWWLTRFTGSATVLATAALVSVIPQVLLGPIAGAYVDRWNRRAVMVAADAAIALLSLWLALLFFTERMQVWHVYVIMLGRALGGIFHAPAHLASATLLVPQEHLTRIQGLNHAVDGALRVASPPLGALLLAVMPLHAVMLIDVGTAALAIALLVLARIPQPNRADLAAGAKPPSVWADVRFGLGYVLRWRGMLGILVLGALLNFVGNPTHTLLPLLVSQQFQGGAMQLGWMQSAWGAGMLAAGLLLGVWGGFKRRVVTSMVAIVLQGLTGIAVGLAPAHLFSVAIACWGLGAFMNVFVNAPLMAMFQAMVAPEVQGRVLTAAMSLSWLAWPLSLAVAGRFADWFGLRNWYILAGVAAVAGGMAGLLIPAIRHVEARGNPNTARAVTEPVPGA